MNEDRPWTRLPAPRPARRVVRTAHHGDTLEDAYAWLRDPAFPEVNDPEILAYLEAENAYLEQALEGQVELREQLYRELVARVAKDDDSVPWGKLAWLYQERYREAQQYPVHVRWPRALGDAGGQQAVVILDENELADGRDFLDVRDVAASADHRLLGYAVDFSGNERFELRFRDLERGVELDDRIPNTQGHLVWSRDGRYVFYARLDEQLRPSRVYRHELGTDSRLDELVYEERDPAFWLGLGETSDEQYLLIECHDKETSEIWYLPADQPTGEFRLCLPRSAGHEYDLDHAHGAFWLRTNDAHRNFRLLRIADTVAGAAAFPGTTSPDYQQLLAPSDAVYLYSFALFSEHLVTLEREHGLPQVRVVPHADPSTAHRIAFPDPAYTVQLGTNPEFETHTLRLAYQSLVTPPEIVDYGLVDRSWRVRKVQKIPSGYDAAAYTSHRLELPGSGGVKIPVTVVHRKDTPLDGTAPLYLYAYGSYGHSIDPYFSANRLSLLDRGFVFAIAHVRGGSELGRAWYEAGKLAHKPNTFDDLVSVARGLAAQGFTSEGRMTVSGGSAGGLLVGAVINRAPQLFHAAVAAVPFVDVLNTMLDHSLPLTPAEYTEWGNPEADPSAYRTIKSYCPYQNVRAQPYPHLLVTAGISDPRVTYWEPAKWVAKLREHRTDDHLLVFHTNTSAGHRGASGRFEALRELAREYAFLLLVYGHPAASARAGT